MTVTTTAVFNDYAGDGTTTAFALLAYCQTAEQVEALVDDVVQSSAGYTVTGLGDAGGVTVTFDTAPADDTVVLVRRVLPLTQDTDTVNNETILQDVLDDTFDRGVMQIQQVQEEVSRAIKVAQGDTAPAFPAAADRTAGQYLVWGNDGESIIGAAGVTPGEVTVSSYMEGVNALASRAALQRELAIVTVSPLSTQFGCVGDGVTDDVVNFQACVDYASALGVARGGIVEIDGGGRAYRFISAPLKAKSNVRIRNLTGLFSTVAAVTPAGYTVYCWVYGAGVLSANITTLNARNIKDALTCSVAGSGLAVDDLVLIGHDGPITTLSAGVNASATSIPVVSTTGYPASGYIKIDSELIAYYAKTATAFTVRASTGRGRNGTTAASHSSGARVFAYNSGRWAFGGASATVRLPVTANYVQAVRADTAGGYDVLMRHSIDRIYSVTGTTSWIKRVTPVKNFELVDCTLIGSTAEGRASGLEYGYYFYLCENVQIRDCRIKNCSDAHGVFDQSYNCHVENQDCYGKANSSTYDGHYGLLINNGCHWITANNVRARNCYKAVTIGASQATSSTLYMGFPRFITLDNCKLYNGGTPWDNAHEMVEIHSYAEHIHIRNCGGADAQGGMSHEGGRNITFEGGAIAHGAHDALSCDGVHVLKNHVCRNISVGRRTKMAGATRLNGAINDVVTTIVLDDNRWITDLQNDFTAILLQIDDEFIQLGTSGADNATFTSVTRGAYGTAAASHSDNAKVYAFGSGYYAPISFDYSQAKMMLDDPDVAPTYLTAAVLVGDTTIPVAETSAFSATGGFAEIEGETLVSGEYPSEIIYYAGRSTSSGAGNLTGCVRAQHSTDATAHSQYFIVQPFTPALSDITISGLSAETDFIRAPITIEGYNPVVNGVISGLQLNYTGALRFNTYGANIEPHNFVIAGGLITNLNYGWRFYGNGITGLGLSGRVDLQDATGGSLVYVDGDRCNVLNCFSDGFYYTARLAGNYGTIRNCTGQRITYSSTEGCYESGTGNSMGGNIRIA